MYFVFLFENYLYIIHQIVDIHIHNLALKSHYKSRNIAYVLKNAFNEFFNEHFN